MATQQEVIKAFMASLNTTTLQGEAALDEAIKACSTFSNFTNDLKIALINDCKNNPNDFLKTYCGIDYDTGAITGSDAGGSQSKDKYYIVPEEGSLDTSFEEDNFTKKDLTVMLADDRTFNDLTDTEKFIWQGLKTWQVESAINLIEESYGENFGFGENSFATAKELDIKFYTEDSSTLARTYANYQISTGKASKLHIEINLHHYNYLQNNLDKANSDFSNTIAHEFTHAVMMANLLTVPVYTELPVSLKKAWQNLQSAEKNFVNKA